MLYELTAKEIKALIEKKEVSAKEVVESYFQRIEEVENKVEAYLTLCREEAFKKAEEIDEKVKRGENLGELAGVPVAIKDNMCTEGIRTTCASRILEDFIPPYDATVVERLKRADAIIIGKTNMDEFAMGSSTENSAFKKTRNPWDLETVPGGSSGGSAASVSAGEACMALGSDTGGSIRQPASLCGIVGLKPTYGLVSRYGLVAFASSLDQIGPMTKDVSDCALMLNVIAGKDERDMTSVLFDKPDYTSFLGMSIKGVRIGIPKEFYKEGIEEGVKQRIMEALKTLEDLGAKIEEISLSYADYALATYYIIAPAEASSNLARYDGIRYGYLTENYTDLRELYMKTRSEGFGREVKRRIMLGTYVLSSGYYDAYYKKALKVRTLIKKDFDKAFGKVDLIVTPTSPTVAFKIGEKAEDPLKMYLADIFTVPVNIAGVPAISIPCGFSDGLPVGLQIIGKPLDEPNILKVSYAYEQASGYYRLKPNI